MRPAPVVLAWLLGAGCASHGPPPSDVDASAESRTPDDPAVWATAMNGDDVELAIVGTDGTTTVLTREDGSTIADPHRTVARFGADGELLGSHSFELPLDSDGRRIAVSGDGRVAVFTRGNPVVEILAHDGSHVRRTLAMSSSTTITAVSGLPTGGFAIAGSTAIPPNSEGMRTLPVVGRLSAPPADGQPWEPTWVVRPRAHSIADDDRRADRVFALPDGTVLVAFVCDGDPLPEPRFGRCDGARSRRHSIAVFPLDRADAWSQEVWLRPPGVALYVEEVIPLAAGGDREGVTVAFDVRRPVDHALVFARWNDEGGLVDEWRLDETGEPFDAAAIGNDVAWLLRRETAEVRRIDLRTHESDVVSFSSHGAGVPVRSRDALQPTSLFVGDGLVRVGGYFGLPSLLVLPDGRTAELQVRDPRGIDDEVFVWAVPATLAVGTIHDVAAPIAQGIVHGP